MLTLMAAFAESEAVSMSDNIKWGKRRRYEKGLIESIAIGNLLGYSQKNGDISVNEEEAETVRLIYRMFLNGFSYADISKYLLEANVPTMRHGARWASTTIINILKNEKYCGDCKFQKTYIQDPITHKAVLNRGELPQFLVEECLPAIIDKEAWLAVQEICARHHYDRKPPCEKIPFRGMVFCGTCGKQYTQYSSCTIGRVRLDYYRCGSRKEHIAIEIPGKTFTTPHKADYNYNPTPALAEYRERYGSKLQPRPMLCTDIKFPVERTQKAFVQVWNLLISKKVRYQSTLQQTAETSDNALIRYKAREMIGLFDEVGRIADFDYSLMLKILDRVEVQPSGKLTFIFLCDIRMTL